MQGLLSEVHSLIVRATHSTLVWFFMGEAVCRAAAASGSRTSTRKVVGGEHREAPLVAQFSAQAAMPCRLCNFACLDKPDGLDVTGASCAFRGEPNEYAPACNADPNCEVLAATSSRALP